jgi:glycosyltransferase involved in cell wall biosynthesis
MQTYKNWECCYDGSSDNSFEVIDGFINRDARFQYYQRPFERLKGANGCRNYGFEKSRGEFIQFFDSDDIMHPHHLAMKVEVLKRTTEINLCTCHTQNFYNSFKTSNLGKISQNVQTGNLYEDYILGNCSILMITPMWRRSVLLNFDLFDETLNQSQDLELYSRILFDYHNIEILSEILIYVRRNNDSISTLNGKLNIHLDSYLEVKRRILKQSPENIKINKAITKMILGVFRYKLASKEYQECRKCLDFIREYNTNTSIEWQCAFCRIRFFFYVFKTTGRGDTRFKFF